MPPTSHVVNIGIDYGKDRGGPWHEVGSTGSVNTVCREVPAPGHPATCQLNLHQVCKRGYCRTRVLVTGTGPAPKNQPFSFAAPEKPASSIRTCRWV